MAIYKALIYLLTILATFCGYRYGDDIYNFLVHVLLLPQNRSHLTDTIYSIGTFLGLSRQATMGMVKDIVKAFLLPPLFILTIILGTRQNTYIKLAALPFVGFTIGLLISYYV